MIIKMNKNKSTKPIIFRLLKIKYKPNTPKKETKKEKNTRNMCAMPEKLSKYSKKELHFTAYLRL